MSANTNSKPRPHPTTTPRAGVKPKPTGAELAAQLAAAGLNVILGAQLAKPNPKPSKK